MKCLHCGTELIHGGDHDGEEGDDYDIVIVDEAHERNLRIDLILLQMKKAMKINPKLKLATSF